MVLTRSKDIVWAVAPERPYRPASILEQIGNTPLLDLSFLVDRPGVELYAKAEWFNPGGSVKDRAALRMIEDAERAGRLAPGQTIGYALVGAAKGYPVHLVMPANVTVERKTLARAYGAQIVESDPLEGSDGAIRLVREIVAAQPERYFYPDQYNNASNWRAHYDTTGPEILCQTDSRVTHFVAGLGTTGTFVGVGRRLKQANAAIQLVALQPADELQIIEGLKHLETSIVPGIYDPTVADRTLPIEAGDALDMTRRLAREAGIFVGFSAGAAVHGARQVANELDSGVVVTLLPDGGAKYLSLGLFD
jgi:cysteine synthase B